MSSSEELLFWVSPAQYLTVIMPALVYPLFARVSQSAAKVYTASSKTRAVILDG